MDVTPPDDFKQPPFSISSTPLTHLPRKRKHDETLESPPFSSTLNESLINEISDIRLHNTPEKRSYLRNTVLSSPIEESRRILYNKIKPVKPERKSVVVNRISEPKNVFLERILNNNLIMDGIFKYLSGGDLYRFGLVAPSCYKAIEVNTEGFARYRVYKSYYQDNKENYIITPPGSPDKPDSPPRTSSENLNRCLRYAKLLKPNQTLSTCRSCEYTTVVENGISQCQRISCGMIYCLLCHSCSETGAKDFVDSCGHAALRPTLGNMSNHMESSFFNFSSQDSGFCSENESPLKVKRNLFSTSTDRQKPLALNNKIKTVVVKSPKKKISYVPVVSNDAHIRKPLDSDSPPRYGYAAGSRQSKKNLKRLTR